MEHHEASAEVEQPRGIRGTGRFIISGLAGGHGVFHWFHQSFLVMLPEVQAALNLSALSVGAITATREYTSGAVTLPGGLMADMLRRHWGLILAGCMGLFGIGWLLIGTLPSYPMLLVGIAIVAMAASMWHLPAMASLSQHFTQRRGTALSFHGIGGNVGDAVGPIVTGALLGVLAWHRVLSVYAAVPLFLTFLVFWAYKDLGRAGAVESPSESMAPRLKAQLGLMTELLRHPPLMGIALVEGLRGMAFLAFITFLPLYFNDEVGMSKLVRGLHFGLLQGAGIVFTPILGYVSDRAGRKLVLVPALAILCLLSVLMVPYGEGIALTAIVGALGIFLYSDQPILTAAALDMAGPDSAATTLGVLSLARFGLSAVSPLIAGALYQGIGFDAVLYYAAGLFAASGVILLLIPMGRAVHSAGHHH